MLLGTLKLLIIVGLDRGLQLKNTKLK